MGMAQRVQHTAVYAVVSTAIGRKLEMARSKSTPGYRDALNRLSSPTTSHLRPPSNSGLNKYQECEARVTLAEKHVRREPYLDDIARDELNQLLAILAAVASGGKRYKKLHDRLVAVLAMVPETPIGMRPPTEEALIRSVGPRGLVSSSPLTNARRPVRGGLPESGRRR